MFGNSASEDYLKRQQKDLKKQLDQIVRQKTELMAVSMGFAFEGSAKTSPDAVMQNLRVLIIQKDNLELQKKIARSIKEFEEEANSTQAKIKILELQLQQPLSLKLIWPAGRETLSMGETYEINWESTGPVSDNVNLELHQSGESPKQIALVSNNGSYMWKIPAPPQGKNQAKRKDLFTILPGADYQIKVIDPTMPFVRDMSPEFSISEPNPKQ